MIAVLAWWPMRRSLGIWALSLLVVLPMGWLVATTPFEAGGRGVLLVGGAVLTAGAVLRFAWQSHFGGRLLPNRCKTCGQGMSRARPGELRPPAGAPAAPRWRCRHCGRLA